MKTLNLIVLTLVATGTASAAQSATVTVLPGDSTWRAASGNSGTAVITSAEPRAGDGSLELRGDRSRFVYGTTAAFRSTSIVTLKDVQSLTFDWMLASDSVNQLHPSSTPALRLHIANGSGLFSTAREMIWEGAYNGVYETASRDTWYTTKATDRFYIGVGNENAGISIADWASSTTYADWRVIGISVGQGSSAGAGYHAFADNVTLNTRLGSTTWNLNATAMAAVPEPATWAMFIGGFGMIGGAMRSAKRKPKVTFATA